MGLCLVKICNVMNGFSDSCLAYFVCFGLELWMHCNG